MVDDFDLSFPLVIGSTIFLGDKNGNFKTK